MADVSTLPTPLIQASVNWYVSESTVCRCAKVINSRARNNYFASGPQAKYGQKTKTWLPFILSVKMKYSNLDHIQIPTLEVRFSVCQRYTSVSSRLPSKSQRSLSEIPWQFSEKSPISGIQNWTNVLRLHICSDHFVSCVSVFLSLGPNIFSEHILIIISTFVLI